MINRVYWGDHVYPHRIDIVQPHGFDMSALLNECRTWLTENIGTGGRGFFHGLDQKWIYTPVRKQSHQDHYLGFGFKNEDDADLFYLRFV